MMPTLGFTHGCLEANRAMVSSVARSIGLGGLPRCSVQQNREA